MINKFKQITFKQAVVLVSLLVFLFIIYQFFVMVSRVGETEVSIKVIPEDSRLSVDDKEVSTKKLFLKSGKYIFKATKAGWGEDAQTIEIGKEKTVVYLLPEPESREANDWLEENKEVQLEREKLGGEKGAQKSAEAVQKNPLIGFLPHAQDSPPFRIDFGPSKERRGEVFLIISGSSPNGRQEALKWIRQQGYDPTDYEIIFADFINPIEEGEDHAH